MQDYPELIIKYNLNKKIGCNCFALIEPTEFKVGDRFRLYHAGEYKGLVIVRVCRRFMLENITEEMALLATGYQRELAFENILSMNTGFKFMFQPMYFVVLDYENTLPKL